MKMDVTDAEFEEKVIKASEKKLVLVDFWAEWCVPCNILTPMLEKVVDSYGDKVILAKINVDGCPETSNKFAIDAIPAVKLFKDGKEVGESIGVVPEDNIRRLIEKHL
ncbi:thioredoxin [Candidatus Woesearchaeota archaeon]|nr:thioredoxin [Candidatus Woesearchaeota archaeon]